MRQILLLCLFIGATAECTLVAQSSPPTDTRVPFQQFKAEGESIFLGTPIKGSHKRFKRMEHRLEDRLDASGRVHNYASANRNAYAYAMSQMRAAPFTGNWTPYGPWSMTDEDDEQTGQGRINCFAFISSNTWLAGSAGGGIWKTTNAGAEWHSISNDLPIAGVSGIVVHPSWPDSIWILTGDGDGRDSPSLGVMKTGNGGDSWDTTAYGYTRTQVSYGYKLIAHPSDHRIQFACATDGLYRTTDGWLTRTFVTGGTFFDLEFKPGDPSIVYLAGVDMVLKSTDGGVSFPANLPLQPHANGSRVALAVTPDDANRLYVLIGEPRPRAGLSSFQMSTNEGASFVQKIDNGNNILGWEEPANDGRGQANYDLAIWADPGFANRVIVGGIDLYRSEDTGNSWDRISEWDNTPLDYLHADIHAIEYWGGELIVGSDGGVYVGAPHLDVWEERTQGLNITQYYDVDAFDDWRDVYEVAGGAQDNGTSLRHVNHSSTYQKVKGGDGFTVLRGKYDGNHARYVSREEGQFYIQEDVDVFGWVEDDITVPGAGKGAWHAPIQNDHHDFSNVFAGYRHLYFNDDAVNLDDWTQVDVDRPYGPAYGASALVTEMAWSYSNRNYFSFIMDGGDTLNDLYTCRSMYSAPLTGNLANTVCTVFSLDSLTGLSSMSVTDVDISAFDHKKVAFTLGGYSAGQKVWRIRNIDSAHFWENISYNLPNVPVLCALQRLEGVYAGTDIGVFFLPDLQDTWIYFSDGMPPVPITDLDVTFTDNRGHEIWASSFGRGIFNGEPADPVRRTRWYVDGSASGFADGSSWANAFTNPQDAFDIAMPTDSIWIAEGVYRPGSSRSSSFLVPQPLVHVYGGFDGTEDSLGQRNPALRLSVLSGDVGVPGDSTDNCYHIMIMSGYASRVRFDGVIFSGGQANGSGELGKGGAVYYSNLGSGTGKPIFRNCQFLRNYAVYGGALHFGDFQFGDADMVLAECRIAQNRATYGGAIHIDTRNSTTEFGDASITIADCNFENNYGTFGGAIYNDCSYGGTAEFRIARCQFTDCTSLFNGGGVYNNTTGGGSVDLLYEDLSFLRNNGSAVYNRSQGGTIFSHFINCRFDSCQGTYGSAVQNDALFGGSADAVYDTCTFQGNSGSYGTLYHNGRGTSADATLSHCRFFNNYNSSTGALSLDGASGQADAILDSCQFVGNYSGSGGAILTSTNSTGSTDVTLTRCLFSGNDAISGGAIYLAGTGHSDVRISDSEFTGNTATTVGGAVYHVGGSGYLMTLEYDNCLFTSNFSASGGGAIYNHIADFSCVNGTFLGNTTDFNGGAIYNRATTASEATSVLLENCVFNANVADDQGGAIYQTEAHPTQTDLRINESQFNGNSAEDGGAVYLLTNRGGTTTLSGCDFSSNLASDDGGAVAILRQKRTGFPNDTARFLFQDVSHQSDTATSWGGALYFESWDISALDLIGSRFVGNSSQNGGGVFVYTGPSGGGSIGDVVLEVERTWMEDNRATHSGGAMYLYASSAEDTIETYFRNVVFTGNTADYGGALRLVPIQPNSQVTGHLEHVTSYGNRAGVEGGFLRAMQTYDTKIDVLHSIFEADSCPTCLPGQTVMTIGGGASGSMLETLIEGGLPTGLVDVGGVSAADPVFVDASDPDGPDDIPATDDDGFVLGAGSPAVDAAFSSLVTQDILGLPRPNGTEADLGAYERIGVCNPSSPPGSISSVVGGSGVTLSWQAVPLSVACEIRGRVLGTPNFKSIKMLGPETDSRFLPAGLLIPGASYEWMVRCACSTAPLIATGFSPLDTFTVPLTARLAIEPVAFDLYPNPTSNHLNIRMVSGTTGTYDLRILDLVGRVRWEAMAWSAMPGSNRSIEVGTLPAGAYLLELCNNEFVQRRSFVVQSDVR